MVSKTIKRTPTKSIRDAINNHRRRARKRSPIKTGAAATSAAVITSINKSIYACHRRIIKFFSKLSRTSTPKRTPGKKGYQLLQKHPEDPNLRRTLFAGNPLPPLCIPEKKTVFLDLDETLVHSVADPPPEKYDFIVRPVIDGQRVNFYVKKRPFVEEFLEFLSGKFEIVIFTAGIKEYASLVLDRIDRKYVISHRLYRDSCKVMDGKYVKDLSELGRDLKNVVIVDDNPNCYMLQPNNAIPIIPFIDDVEDRELEMLVDLFQGFDHVEDMRDAVKKYVEEGNKKVEV